jgi:hypothetical protein
MIVDGEGAADKIQVNDCAVRSLHTRMPQMFGIWRFPCFRCLVARFKRTERVIRSVPIGRSRQVILPLLLMYISRRALPGGFLFTGE